MSQMQLTKASRKKAKIKMAIQSPSGGGKTMSALLIAYGICGDWNKIAVIDTENNSADLYSHLGEYNTLPMSPPYSPEKYIEAIDVCTTAGMKVIVIDSASHEWDFLLEYHNSLTGNSFTNWGKVTPRHEHFVNKILQTNAHFICTIRSKTDYVMSERNGKQVPEKVGLKGVQRDNLEYEFTVVLELDMSHRARVSKDRTNLFSNKIDFVPSVETGKEIADWCNSGNASVYDEIMDAISKLPACNTVEDLTLLKEGLPAYVVASADFKTASLARFHQVKPQA
jgi:hypothetical protein